MIVFIAYFNFFPRETIIKCKTLHNSYIKVKWYLNILLVKWKFYINKNSVIYVLFV